MTGPVLTGTAAATLTDADGPVFRDPSEVTAVQVQRLQAVSRALLPDAPVQSDAAALLDVLVGTVLDDPAPDRVWLLVVALSGRFPDDDELRLTMRTLALTDRVSAALWLLDDALAASAGTGTAAWPLQLVEGGVVVDVDYSARHDLHTGIQRVVRTTLPRWTAEHDLVPVVWTDGHRGMRRLRPDEHDRVYRWGAAPGGPEPRVDPADPAVGPDGLPVDVLVVPWRSSVVLLEVPVRAACERLAAVGQWSGNRVVAVGYDCIPVVSAGLVPLVEPDRFVHYLTAVKHMTDVVGISDSATREFRGFAAMLAGQGLVGPAVSECALPVDAAGAPAPASATTVPDLPMVLCVGSFEPRKNQLAVLWAAEVLWREGHRFALRFVGGGGWGTEFPRAVRRLRRAGRPVEVLTSISEDGLDASYRAARFTVFVSVHEGYGLPVAESLARDTPAVVSSYGSVAEIGADGGVLLVDPRDDLQVLDGLRRLLTDDALLARLTDEIAVRPRRTWDDYARELWLALGLGTPRTGQSADGVLHA